MEVTDERKAVREQLAELTILAVDLAAERCELASQMANLYQQQQALGEQMERLGGKELSVHKKRKELAGLILAAPIEDMSIV